jgi:hypothetical protein
MKAAAIATAILLPVTLFTALGGNVYYRAIESEHQRSDFLTFHAAARTMVQGGDVYAVRHPRGWHLYYPPGMPALLTPLALLPIEAAVIAWYLIGLGGLWWVFVRLVRLCDELAGRPVGPVVVAAIGVNFGPLVSGLQRGQFSVLLFALMVEALWCYRRGRAGWCGVWLGLAAGVKVYPALLVLPLLVRREWRAVFAFGAGLSVLWIGLPMVLMGPTAGWHTTRHFAADVLLPMLSDNPLTASDQLANAGYFSPSNQSLFGLGGRWLARSAVPIENPCPVAVADLPVPTVRRAATVLGLGLVVTMALLFVRKPERRSFNEAWLWSLPILAAIFISPIGWHHYYTVLALPYALTGTALIVLEPGRRRAILGATLGVAVAGNWLHFASYACRETGILLVTSLLLWVVLAIAARRFTSLADPARSPPPARPRPG